MSSASARHPRIPRQKMQNARGLFAACPGVRGVAAACFAGWCMTTRGLCQIPHWIRSNQARPECAFAQILSVI